MYHKKYFLLLIVFLLILNQINAEEYKNSIDATNANTIQLHLKQGEIAKFPITIRNFGLKNSNIVVETENLDIFSPLIKKSLDVPSQEAEEISLILSASNNQAPDVYFGRLIIKEHNKVENQDAYNILKVINVVADVSSKNILIDSDIKVDIKVVRNNSGLPQLVVGIKNIEALNPTIDFGLYVKDISGNLVFSKKENLAIKDSITVNEKLNENFSEQIQAIQTFVVYTKIRNNGDVYVNSAVFDKSLKTIEKRKSSLLLPLIFLTLFIPVLIYLKGQDFVKVWKNGKTKSVKANYFGADDIKKLRIRVRALDKFKKHQ